jgi:hypothetical protein
MSTRPGAGRPLWACRFLQCAIAQYWRWRLTLDLLAPIYGWFTEGFETRDHKEAKALLDELAL